MEEATVQTIDTSDGVFTIIAVGAGAGAAGERVLASGWNTDAEALLLRIHNRLRPSSVRPGETVAAEAVAAYYRGELDAPSSITVAQAGTELQMKGWQALRNISPEQRLDYAEFAERLGQPGAARVVASICAKNAAGLFVPCHRVMRKDGGLGGFAWGLDVKQSLMARESASSMLILPES